MRQIRGALAITGFIAVLPFVASCGGGTEPVGPDVYDVTAVLDSFSFETPAPSPPDCPATPGGFPYCTHHRAYTGATLSGTLVTVTGPSGLVASASGTFGGKFCSSYAMPDGCSATAPTAAIEYGAASIVFVNDVFQPSTTPRQFEISLNRTDPVTFNTSYVDITAWSNADSLYGTVRWILVGGRSPPTHTGRFVAHRRK